jgi:hypothetical protein
MDLIYRTANDVAIYVVPSSKSRHGFIIKYREVGKELRTLKRVHLVVDLFAKRTGNHALTNQLVDHIINNIILQISPTPTYPPALQVFNPVNMERFDELSRYGEYSIEFLLVITELIMI